MHALDSTEHSVWLAAESDRLMRFFEKGAVNAAGGFNWMSSSGTALADAPQPLWLTARLVHCFSVEQLLGRPGAYQIAKHGVEQLLTRFEDQRWGGFHSAIDSHGVACSSAKETYGHAFALLAGTNAHRAGIPGAQRVVEVAMHALDTKFWAAAEGAAFESFNRDWTQTENYRGQNANMHLTEAYLAVYEATGSEICLQRAVKVAERLIDGAAREHSWRIPEHFDHEWRVNAEYGAQHSDDQFRPEGTLIGHSFEWCRLVLQLGSLSAEVPWAVEAAVQLFQRAVADGWDAEQGGFVYSVDLSGAPLNTSRMHWTLAEAIGAAVWLYRVTGDAAYAAWYEKFWGFVDDHLIDRSGGSWWHELDETNVPAATVWDGKPDLYHAWQATLYSRIDGPYGVAEAAVRGVVSEVPYRSGRFTDDRIGE